MTSGDWCAFAHKRHTHTTLCGQYSHTNGLFIRLTPHDVSTNAYSGVHVHFCYILEVTFANIKIMNRYQTAVVSIGHTVWCGSIYSEHTCIYAHQFPCLSSWNMLCLSSGR